MKNAYAITEPSPSGVNEDLYRLGADFALVIDGAGRYPGRSGSCVHPVTWVVRHLADHIERTVNLPTDLRTIVREAIAATMEDHGAQCDLSDPLSPGAALAIARVQDNTLHWLVIADCAVVIEHPDGDHTVVIDDRVDHLPDAPITSGATRTYAPEYVATVRNKPGGFWVAGAVPEAADHALTGSLDLDHVRRVLVCSDGISRLTERYGASWDELFALVEDEGPEALVATIREAEVSDPDPRRWRGKRHDDATAVLFQPNSRS